MTIQIKIKGSRLRWHGHVQRGNRNKVTLLLLLLDVPDLIDRLCGANMIQLGLFDDAKAGNNGDDDLYLAYNYLKRELKYRP